jgi:acetyltransferase
MTSAYPDELVCTRHLPDGRPVTIRPVRPEDVARQRAFLDRQSHETLYRRFHKWIPVPSDRLVRFLTHVDYDRHMALVATFGQGEDEAIIGEARYTVNPDGASCEFGIMVSDGWHNLGIAGLLMEALMQAARNHGLKTIEGLVLSNNTAMLRFARGLGFELHGTPEDLTIVRIIRRL